MNNIWNSDAFGTYAGLETFLNVFIFFLIIAGIILDKMGAFSESDPCAICADPGRNRRLVCVVEEPGDQMLIEKTGAFGGLYHILHGVLSPMDGIGPEELKVRELLARVQNGVVDEVLIATSSTVPGEATAAYLAGELERLGVTASRLACGIPMGMDLKYTDEYTLAQAIRARQSMRRQG